MDALAQQIADLLDGQETRYRTLKRILARQVACLQRADLAGVGTTNAEIREAMGQLAGIETQLTPLVRQWQERPEAAGSPISEKAQAMCAMVGVRELEEGNVSLARKTLRGACQGNDPLACMNLGLLDMEDGNWGSARGTLKKACDLGEVEACSTVQAIEEKTKKGR